MVLEDVARGTAVAHGHLGYRCWKTHGAQRIECKASRMRPGIRHRLLHPQLLGPNVDL